MTTRRSFLAAIALGTLVAPAFANNRGKTRVGGRGSSGKGGHYVSRAPKSSSTKSAAPKSAPARNTSKGGTAK